MKTKSIMKRVLAILVMAVVVAGTFAGVLAAKEANTYTPIAVNGVTFTKNLVLNEELDVPDVEFDFTISSVDVDAIPATTTTYEVRKGIGSPTIGTNKDGKVAFASTDETTAGAATNVAGSSAYKFASKTVPVNFDGIDFTAPGIYRYYITETATAWDSFGTFEDDAKPIRTLDVYIVDVATAATPTLAFAGAVMYEGMITDAPEIKADPTEAVPVGSKKSDNYTNQYESYSLELAKEVSGNQADKTRFFEFQVEITGEDGTVLSLDTTNAVVDETNGINVFSADDLVMTGGGVALVFKLQHGQSIKIDGIPFNAEIRVTEKNMSDLKNEGYSATIAHSLEDDETALAKINEDETSGEIVCHELNKNISITFTNTKEGLLPTGIMMKVAPIAAGAVVIFAIILLMAVRMKKEEE